MSWLRLTILAVLLAGVVPATKKAPPPKPEELATTWVGLTEDEVYLIRLDLMADGHGEIGYAFVDSAPRVFPIQSWTLRDRTIHLSIGPKQGEVGLVASAQGHAGRTALSLVLEGPDWKRRAEFRREDSLEKRWKGLRRAMGAERP